MRLNFRRRPFLCTTLYRNLYKRSTSVVHLTNFSDEFFYGIFTEDVSTSSIPWCKKVKDDQKPKSRGSCLKLPKKQTHCMWQEELWYGQTRKCTSQTITFHHKPCRRKYKLSNKKLSLLCFSLRKFSAIRKRESVSCAWAGNDEPFFILEESSWPIVGQTWKVVGCTVRTVQL